jgi:hypothetical protein
MFWILYSLVLSIWLAVYLLSTPIISITNTVLIIALVAVFGKLMLIFRKRSY